MKLGPVPIVKPTSTTTLPVFADTDIGATQLDLTPPDWAQEGDLLILLFTHKGADYGTVPAAWTLIEQNVINGTRGEAYWKRAGASEAEFSITDLADTAVGAVFAVANALPSGDPIHMSTSRANASPAKGTAGLTPTTDRCLLINAAFESDNITHSNWQGAEIIDSRTGIGTDCAVGCAVRYQITAASTGATTWGGTNVDNVGMLIAILPDPAEADLYSDVSLSDDPATNLSAATAYTIPSLPYTIDQTLTDISPDQAVWFKYTPVDDTGAVYILVGVNVGLRGVISWETTTYYGNDPGSLTENDTIYDTLEKQFYSYTAPMRQGQDLYIKIVTGQDLLDPGIGVNAPLILQVLAAPNTDIAAGNMLITDDTFPYPALVMDETDGSNLKYFPLLPAGEVGAVASDGHVVLENNVDRQNLVITDENLSIIATPAQYGDRPTNATMVGRPTGNFYSGSYLSGETGLTVQKFSTTGTLLDTWTTTIPIDMELGVNSAETLLYYISNGDTDLGVWDLGTNAALTPITLAFPGSDTYLGGWTSFIVHSDGTMICAGYSGANGYRCFRFSLTDGSLLNTYDFIVDPANEVLDRITHDNTESYFWVWTQFIVSMSRFYKIKVSDGTIDTTFAVRESSAGLIIPAMTDISTGATQWDLAPDYDAYGYDQYGGHSTSCHFFILGATTAAPSTDYGFNRTLVHDEDLMEGRAGWFYDLYSPTLLIHYGEEGSAQETVLCGGYDGKIYSMGGDSDNDVDIACQVRTPSRDQSDLRYNKLYGDIMLDADADGDTLSATPGFNNHVTTHTAIDLTNSVRTAEIVTFDDWQAAKNVSLDVSWTHNGNRALLYMWEPRFTEEGGKISAYTWETDYITHGLNGYIYHGYLYLVHTSTADLTFTIYDGSDTSLASITVTNSGGLQKKDFLRLPVVKGVIFKYTLSSATQFTVEGPSSELLLKPWGSTEPWIRRKIFQDIAIGTAQ